MATVYIDGNEHEVEDGKNMLEVCLSLGYDLTYFCWHPAMDSVGACRQCAVMNYKDENDTKGKLTMACMLAANDGTRVSIGAERAHDFREGNIESLMISHPHDCPVCDEGGECHLQDMTIMAGHNYRRYRFKKRTHLNQDLGPFLNHEMNRCIQCYRCVRFYNDYAGGKDFGVFASKDNVYFGRSEPGTLDNEFSGNLVEVCPTGVFTDKTLRRHYTRKWDLSNAPSICHQCGLGCNIISSERYGSIRRVLTRYNGDVNGYFLCDRGRFGYEYTNSEDRMKEPLKKKGEGFQPLAMEKTAEELKPLIALDRKLVGIGSPRASVESNFMLKELVGDENFYGGVPKIEGKLVHQVIDILQKGKVRTPSMKEAEKHDAVFVLGEDVTNTAPMLALALRQSAKQQPRGRALRMRIPKWDDAAIREIVQDDLGPFYLATTHSTKLDQISTQSYYGHPDNIARLGMAVAHKVNSSYPAVSDLDKETEKLAERIAKDLLEAEKPLIVSGTSLYSESVIVAASEIAHALKDKNKNSGLIYTVPEVNTMGMTILSENFLEDALESVRKEQADTLIVLENDLTQRIDKEKAADLFQNSKQTIVLENMTNATTALADYILPAGTYAESTGTVINNEGRAQRFYQIFQPKNDMRSSWEWLDAIQKLPIEKDPEVFDKIVDRIIVKYPELKPVKETAPTADFREGTQKIPRKSHRYSGRTATNANVKVSEEKPPEDDNSPLSYTMEGFQGVPASSVTPFYRAPGWNSVQAINKYQIEVGGPLHDGNPGKRLLEPAEDGELNNSNEIPKAFKPEDGVWQILPFYHIFGSEELSGKSPAIVKRSPETYLALNQKDAEKCEVKKDGDKITLNINNENRTFKVKIVDSLPEGVAGLPKGLKDTAGIAFPFSEEIKKD